jgi:hypothetical protein
MNANELVHELKKVGNLFDWTLVPHPNKVDAEERRARPRLRLRGRSKNGPQEFLFEPIGAVCYVRTGIAYDEDHWLESAYTLELPAQDAKDLVAAANDLAWRQIDEKREPHAQSQMLRRSMMAALGLEIEVAKGGE